MTTKTTMLAVLAVAFAALSCQKPGEDLSFGQESLNELSINTVFVNCPPTPISQSITSPLTLTTGNSYLLETGNTVVDGTTLTIQPGVVIFAESGAALIIKTNATINAAGTSTNPIVFTSDQNPGSRAPADWRGIYVFGQAPNNQSNSLTLDINGTNFTGGGSTAAHNSGTLEYVQIHFAGAGGGGPNSGRREESALVLTSLGSGTTVNHIQVTESNLDGVASWGGTVALDNIITHKVRRTDFMVSYGYTGNGQYLAGVKHNATANTSGVNAYGMEISDFFVTESALSNVHTHPTFSNISLLGWAFCSVSVNNADAISFREDGNGRIYNSVISSFDQYALYLDGSSVVGNTSGNPELQFAYNSLHNIALPRYNHNGSWTGCGLDMDEWITGAAGIPCQELGNQFTVTTLGLGTGDVCVSCPTQPDFSLGTNTLSAPNFTWDSGSVFDHPNHRGAFGATPWVTTGWADFCPQSFDYCL